MLAIGAMTVLGLVAVPVAAHEGNNHGTVKVHDDAVVEPATRNDPHVSCDFWIEGFNMSDDTGHGEFTRIPPSANPPEDAGDFEWVADGPDDDGWHFLAGPFNLDPGHYRVDVFVDQGHPGNEDHQAKSKVFWVDPCGDFSQECPEDLEARAESDGDVFLDWDAPSGSDPDSYNVYRRVEGSGDAFELIGTTTQTHFTDNDDLEVGTSYEYMVTSVFDGREVEPCPTVVATVIPFFTGPVGVALAAAGGVGALALLRRRNS